MTDISRRGFLKLFGTAAITAAALEIDPERLLWVPGAKTIFLPPAKTTVPLVHGDEAEASFAEVQRRAFEDVLASGDVAHEVCTAVGTCQFDASWNLLSVGGRPVTVREAALLQINHYQRRQRGGASESWGGWVNQLERLMAQIAQSRTDHARRSAF